VEAARDDGGVMVSVRDTGIGVAPDKLESIFEMFTQVDRRLERSHGGLGIGLTLVRRLVDLHGGSVSARSEGLGKGSEFIVRLPAWEGAREEPPPRKAAEISGRRILVVDDNPHTADSLAMLLELSGNATKTANDGPQALQAAAGFAPQVVLLDLGLPGMSGYDVCRAMRRESWGNGIVIVALSGWGQEDARRKSRDAGFDAHLVKPVEYGALAELLAALSPVNGHQRDG
jgi:CheY-like chemotaxis protein